jgi:Tol biopolymer transport system component
MTGHDDFDRTLADWFQADALAPAPAGGLDRILDATRGRRPRPAWVASVGSDWVWEAPEAVSSPGLRSRLVWAIVVVALVAALAAAAALVGSRLIERPPTGGLLAYAMNDNIYLADQDGAHPRKVTAGVPWANATGGGPSYVLGDGGPAWAPDGRHLLFFDLQGAAPQLTVHIADASGHVVASIPNIWVDATWSPDSTRIEAWTGGSDWIGTTQISIFGIDGALQESLPLPTGYVRVREYPGFWAGDGRSVYARLGQGAGPTAGVWQLPIDGSTPRHLAANDPLSSTPTVTHDGRRVAFVNNPDGAPTLFVSNTDGTDPRVLAVGQTSASTGDGLVTSVSPGTPRWSPDDQRIAYAWVRTTDGATQGTTWDSDLRIVDVASGTVHTLVADEPDIITLLGWSPAGDELLYSTSDQAGRTDLWTVNGDGTRRTLVVAGAEGGYWQPVQTPRVDRVPASVPPTAESSPASAAASPAVPTLPPFTRSDQGFLLDEQTGMAVTGHLGQGTYTYTNVDAQGFNVRFTVPAGWTWYGRYLSKGGVGLPGGAAIYFFGGPVQVYGDPCHWAGSPSNPPTGPSVDDLMAALATHRCGARRPRSSATRAGRP